MTATPPPGDPIAPLRLDVRGVERLFDIDDPDLPAWIDDHHLTADDFPYSERMPKKAYEAALEKMQVELVKLQYWLQDKGERVMILFEGRDAAGKGGMIFVIRRYMNPRTARNVALTKPSEVERGQWYFQRYVAHFPTDGEFVTFDRSWYNRGVVEPVMGFCTQAETEKFFREVPTFEATLVDDGIHLSKFWLNISHETQLKRFHDRRHDPLKTWKFSPIDVAGMSRWDDYTAARDAMLERTHSQVSPWIVVRANDKRRARLGVMARILRSLPYEGRDMEAIETLDASIIADYRSAAPLPR